MRWLRLGLGKRQVQHDSGPQQALLLDIRQRFGAHEHQPFADQAAAVEHLLAGDDGLYVAIKVLHEFAETSQNALLSQVAALHRRTGQGYVVDRRNYRQLWRAAGPHLRWPLFDLPGGLHPFVQVSAAVQVVGAQARQAVRSTTPEQLLAEVFEALDLTAAGWEFGGIPATVDAATLTDRSIATARQLRAAMSSPPPLPEPVRELMRRNNTIDVFDPTGTRVVGALNPGKLMRETLLT